MKTRTILQLGLFILPLFAQANAPEPAKDSKFLYSIWQKILHPSSGDPSAIGSYSAGCLAGGTKLDLDGPGYSVMRPSRVRYFGHPSLVEYIRSLSEKTKSEKLPRLLIGDLGRPRGGPMISGHMSHQSGLDVDIWFMMSKKKPTQKDRETWGAPSYVTKDKRVTKAWNDSHRKLMALAADSPMVDRIFVHAAIKRDLCEKFPEAPWLYKVRAWYAHHDHLHVRLRCPEGSGECENQAALDPKDPQCGESLAWWFSKEADEEWSKKSTQIAGREFPKLPQACDTLVEEMQASNLESK